MSDSLENLPDKAKSKYKENKKFFAKLKKKPPQNLDQLMQDLHEEEFSQRNCLDCANCCKTTGPLFTDRDISRISGLFNMNPSEFIETYLYQDEDNDYVLQSLPCPFLNEDNTCLIYDVRPKACAEFPHTTHKNFQKISNLTMKNVAICPAAFNIVERMKDLLN